jgi:hypothetical protein
MAKKVVASLKVDSGKGFAKVIRMEKSPKTGAYSFKEDIIASDKVKDYFTQK